MKLKRSFWPRTLHGLMPRLMTAFLGVTLGVIIISALLLHQVSHRFLLDQIELHLRRESYLLLELLPALPPADDANSIAQLQQEVAHLGRTTDMRITLIAPDGTVLADSTTDPGRLENHRDRPEVAAALDGRMGRAIRFSSTLNSNLLYLALPIGEPTPLGVLRTALPIASVEESLQQVRSILLRLSLGTLAAASLFAFLFSRHVVRPLKEMTYFARRMARGRFEPPISISAQGELGQLATAFNTMAARLKQSLSELSEQRAYLQSVVGSMAEGVIAVDSEGMLVLVNPAAEELLGLSQEEVIGRPLKEVVELGSLVEAIEGTLKSQEGQLIELELEKPSRRIVRAHTAALQGHGVDVGGALGLIYDITELRHLERVRTDFVANVSHELRTPLTSIHGFTETLLDGADEDPKTRRRFLEIINRETQRVTAIINDLLDLSRLESEKLNVSWSDVTLRQIIDETLPLVADVAQQKQIALRVNVAPRFRVRADEALLRQVFINLLDNAVKYTPDGGGEVTVEAQEEGDLVRVTLSDTGIGIPQADLPRIFERFYRVDRARSRQMGGTGLGLSIVRHLVERLGGTIHAESAPGKGTRMIFTLRRAE